MRKLLTLTLLLAFVMIMVACSSASEATATAAVPGGITATPAPTLEPTAAADPFATVPGIVDSTNHGWPREVDGLNGRVSVPAKPDRIINASVGHGEITFALVSPSRVVGVGASTLNPTHSSVADLAAGLPVVTQDPETIVALAPDVIVTSPFFPADGVDALERLGIPVIQTELSNDAESRISDILLIGYIYGEETRALELAAEVRVCLDRLRTIVDRADGEPPRVLALTRYFDSIWTAGSGSTEGGIIEAAGAVNVAAQAGVESNQTTSLEGVISMQPDIIIIPQPAEFGAGEFMDALNSDASLAELPAVRDGRVYVVESRYFTTLSFWNLIGTERLGRLLWPEAFEGEDFGPFSTPSA
jgi:iron complex transport system substrate-binding protein